MGQTQAFSRLSHAGSTREELRCRYGDGYPLLLDVAPRGLGLGTSWQIPAHGWQHRKSPASANICGHYLHVSRTQLRDLCSPCLSWKSVWSPLFVLVLTTPEGPR